MADDRENTTGYSTKAKYDPNAEFTTPFFTPRPTMRVIVAFENLKSDLASPEDGAQAGDWAKFDWDNMTITIDHDAGLAEAAAKSALTSGLKSDFIRLEESLMTSGLTPDFVQMEKGLSSGLWTKSALRHLSEKKGGSGGGGGGMSSSDKDVAVSDLLRLDPFACREVVKLAMDVVEEAWDKGVDVASTAAANLLEAYRKTPSGSPTHPQSSAEAKANWLNELASRPREVREVVESAWKASKQTASSVTQAATECIEYLNATRQKAVEYVSRGIPLPTMPYVLPEEYVIQHGDDSQDFEQYDRKSSWEEIWDKAKDEIRRKAEGVFDLEAAWRFWDSLFSEEDPNAWMTGADGKITSSSFTFESVGCRRHSSSTEAVFGLQLVPCTLDQCNALFPGNGQARYGHAWYLYGIAPSTPVAVEYSCYLKRTGSIGFVPANAYWHFHATIDGTSYDGYSTGAGNTIEFGYLWT